MGRIAIIAAQVDAGTRSGGDKYTRDLVRLIRDMGHEPVVLQKGEDLKGLNERLQFLEHQKQQVREQLRGVTTDIDSAPFRAKIREIEAEQQAVHAGTQAREEMWEGVRLATLPNPTIPMFNHQAYKVMAGSQVDAAIYMTIQIAYPRVHPNSVAVSHGVPWDSCFMNPDMPEDFWLTMRPNWATVLGNVQKVVSCDANTINLFQFLYQAKYMHKFVRVPNYADLDKFKPVNRDGRRQVTVLYPRRLDVARGYNEMLSVSEMLVAKYPNVRVLFCGHGNEPDATARHAHWCSQRERIDYQTAEWDEMPAVYQAADIAVTPTLACEGTSLAALESLASGLPVVATWQTAMPEMVQDGVNGYLVAPEPKAIFNAVCDLVDNPLRRQEMGKMARRMAVGFAKSRWDAKWTEVIEDLLK